MQPYREYRRAGRAVSGLAIGLSIWLLPGSHGANAQPIFQPGAPGSTGKWISPAESEDLARTGVTAMDRAFMEHMIVHHQQAVDMVALMPPRALAPELRLLGERIALSQEREIGFMRQWLVRHVGDDATAGHGHDHGAHANPAKHGAGSMTGMLSPMQMRDLAAARGREFDRLFLLGMIQHHQGAIDMVRGLAASEGAGEETALAEFMNSVVADQSVEIARMRAMLGSANPVRAAAGPQL